MTHPNASRRRRHRTHLHRARAFFALCAIAGIALAIGAVVGVPIPTPYEPQPSASSNDPEPLTAGDFAAALPPREVYKYSVIDGGAYTAAELTDAVNRDRVVAAHYRSIDMTKVRAEIVDAERLAYMSYRRGDQIYWTKHKVRLRQGETILTDGATQVRSRCGNCISLEPMQPTAEDEPDTVEFEALTINPIAVPSLPSSARAFTIPPGLLLPPPFGTAPVDPSGPLAIGPIAGNIGDAEPTNPGNVGEPGGIDRPIDLFPVPPDVFPGPPLPGSGSHREEPPSTSATPPLIVVTPPFTPPIEVPDDFTPDEPLNPPEDTVPVPEPGTLLLIGTGVIGLVARRRRSR